MKRKTLFNLSSILGLVVVLASLSVAWPQILFYNVMDSRVPAADSTFLVYGIPATCATDPVILMSPEELEACQNSTAR